jgi:hypothetical protein
MFHALLPTEVIAEITSHVTHPKTYKQLLLSCKVLYEANHSVDRRNSMCNHLWTLINIFPNESWDWNEVYSNPNTTMANIDSMIQKNPNIAIWNNPAIVVWNAICANPNVTMDYIKQNLPRSKGQARNIISQQNGGGGSSDDLYDYVRWSDCEWPMFKNPNLTFEFLEEYLRIMNKSPINNELRSRYIEEIMFDASSRIKIEDIDQNLSKYDWNLEQVLHNPTITMKFVEKYIDMFKCVSWHGFSQKVSMQYIEDHPDYPWGWNYASSSSYLTIDFIKKHFNTPKRGKWLWIDIFNNKYVPTKDLDEYLLSIDPLKLEEIMQEVDIDIVELDYCSHIGPVKFTRGEFDIIDAIRQSNRCVPMYKYSKSPNITMADVKSHLGVNWNWRGIELNPNLTFDFVLDMQSNKCKLNDGCDNFYWDFRQISQNTFGHK